MPKKRKMGISRLDHRGASGWGKIEGNHRRVKEKVAAKGGKSYVSRTFVGRPKGKGLEMAKSAYAKSKIVLEHGPAR